jgi:CRP/FNR family transcriptional regulator, cyclic AMP receptor protein
MVGFCAAERFTMKVEREVRLLSLVDVLEPLSEEELEDVATRCKDIRLDADEEFFGSEEYDGGLFLLEEGHLVVYKLTSSGTQLTIALHSAGAVLPALRLRGLYVKALEPSVLAFMSREVLVHFLQRNLQLGLLLVEILAEQLCFMDTRLSDVIHKDVRSRLASFLLWLISEEGVVVGSGDYVVPYRYTHAQLGTIIGAKRVAVTRAFGFLQDEGVVQVLRRRIHVRNLGLLRRIAEQEH